MPRTKNVSAPGGGDDEDPPRPFRQVKGKTVYLEQQEGRKKQRLDRAARAAATAAAAAEQAEQGAQLQIPSDQIAYRFRRHASRARSSAPTTPSTASTPATTSPAPVTPAPSTTSAIPTTSTTPASTAPSAPLSTPPIPPARFRERDETEVRPLAADPRLFDLQRATAAWVRRFRYVPVESWLPALRDPAAEDPFSTRIQESFYRAQLSAQIALRAHRLLDLPAFLLAAGADSEVHLSYLPGLLTLLTTSGRYVEE
jgi:type II secretory pathway pseudopilin PulG